MGECKNSISRSTGKEKFRVAESEAAATGHESFEEKEYRKLLVASRTHGKKLRVQYGESH